MSLTEVVIATGLLVGLMGAIMTTFASSQRSFRNLAERTRSTREGQLMIDTASKQLRMAARPTISSGPAQAAFLVASAREACFFSARVNQTSRWRVVRLSVDANDRFVYEAVEVTGSTPPTSCPTTFASRQVVGEFVANTPSSALFTYYSAPGAVATSLSAIKFVALDLRVRTTSAIPATQLVNQVRLPNVL